MFSPCGKLEKRTTHFEFCLIKKGGLGNQQGVQLPEDLLCLDSKKAEWKTVAETQQREIRWSLILQC